MRFPQVKSIVCDRWTAGGNGQIIFEVSLSNHFLGRRGGEGEGNRMHDSLVSRLTDRFHLTDIISLSLITSESE